MTTECHATDGLTLEAKMKLQEQLFRKIKAQGKSIKTAETYWHYCEDYLLRLKHKSGNWIHPSKAGRLEIEEWLSYLANEKHVSKNSQNTALQAVLYLYREILGVSIQNVSAMRSKRPVHTPEVYRPLHPNKPCLLVVVRFHRVAELLIYRFANG